MGVSVLCNQQIDQSMAWPCFAGQGQADDIITNQLHLRKQVIQPSSVSV